VVSGQWSVDKSNSRSLTPIRAKRGWVRDDSVKARAGLKPAATKATHPLRLSLNLRCTSSARREGWGTRFFSHPLPACPVPGKRPRIGAAPFQALGEGVTSVTWPSVMAHGTYPAAPRRIVPNMTDKEAILAEIHRLIAQQLETMEKALTPQDITEWIKRKQRIDALLRQISGAELSLEE
jgi:hypothetical protein